MKRFLTILAKGVETHYYENVHFENVTVNGTKL